VPEDAGSGDDECWGKWKSEGNGRFCSWTGMAGPWAVLWERFREGGVRLESAGTNLASAGRPSSLAVVRSFTSKPDPWREVSKSGSLESKRKSRRPGNFDGTKTGLLLSFPIVSDADGEKIGSVDGLSGCPGYGGAELISSSGGDKPTPTFAFVALVIVRGGNANGVVLRFGPSSKLFSTRKARLAARSRAKGVAGEGGTTGEPGRLETASLLAALNPGMRKGSGAVVTSASKRWRRDVGSFDDGCLTVADASSSHKVTWGVPNPEASNDRPRTVSNSQGVSSVSDSPGLAKHRSTSTGVRYMKLTLTRSPFPKVKVPRGPRV
jgi:hypothetical protein